MGGNKSKGVCADISKIVLKGDIEELKQQVKAGANVKVKNRDGKTLLHTASRGGCIEFFLYLTQLDLDPWDVDNDGRTVLHAACLEGKIEMAEHLVFLYPDLKNKCDNDKCSVLHYCARGGSVEIFKLLVSHGLDVNSVTSNGKTVLHLACFNGRYKMAEHLVSQYPDLKNKCDGDKHTALHDCALGGSVEIFKLLVSQGLDVNSVTSSGKTVLHLASYSSRYEMADHIVSQYPDLKNICSSNKYTALHDCARGGSVEIFKLLVSHGLDVSSVTSNGKTVLHLACFNGRYKMAEHLLSKYSNLKNKRDGSRYTALHDCARGGSVEIFKLLVSQGLDVNSVFSKGRTVLHLASYSGRYEMVEHIVSKYPDLKNICNNDKYTALHDCALGGSVEIFKLLVSQGLDVKSVTSNGKTVLHLASYSRRYEMVQHIVSQYPDLKNKCDSNKYTVLHDCARGGSVEIFKLLVSQGLDVNSVTSSGKTVLHLACDKSNYKMAEHLVAQYPDLKNIHDINEFTALHDCARGGSVEIFKLLVSHGLDVSSVFSNGKTVLHLASYCSRYEMVEHILSQYPDLKNKCDTNKGTALHYCAVGGSVDIFKLLVSKGLDVNSVTSNAETVLHLASYNSRYKIVEYLVSRYPDLKNKCDSNICTVLHYCVCGGSVDIFKLLVSQGLDVNSLCSEGKTLLHLASYSRRYEMAEHIVSKYPALKNICNNDKYTALHDCARGGSVEIFKLLVSHGLDANSVTSNGKTVLHLASYSSRYEMVEHIVSQYPDLKNKCDCDKFTALHDCARGGSADVFKLLVSHGLDVNSVTSDGKTVLHVACFDGNFEGVKYILETHPEMMTSTTTSGETPLDVAIEWNHQQISSCLTEHKTEKKTDRKDLPYSNQGHALGSTSPILASSDAAHCQSRTAASYHLHTLASLTAANQVPPREVTSPSKMSFTFGSASSRNHLADRKPSVRIPSVEAGDKAILSASILQSSEDDRPSVQAFSIPLSSDEAQHQANLSASILQSSENDPLSVNASSVRLPADEVYEATSILQLSENNSPSNFAHPVPMSSDEFYGQPISPAFIIQSSEGDPLSVPPDLVPALSNETNGQPIISASILRSPEDDPLSFLTHSIVVSSDEADEQANLSASILQSSEKNPSSVLTHSALMSSDEAHGQTTLSASSLQSSEDDPLSVLASLVLMSSDEDSDYNLSSSVFLSVDTENNPGATIMEEQTSSVADEDVQIEKPNDSKDKTISEIRTSSLTDQDVYISKPDNCQTCQKKAKNKVNKSGWYCKNCRDLMCDECKSFHDVFTPIRNHVIISLYPQCGVCDEDEAADWFCSDCREFLSEDCKRYHQKQKITKHHVIVSSKEELTAEIKKSKP